KILREKTANEAEVYGLKIRQLVSPVFEHQFPPFRWWTAKEAAAAFPVETENMISRLGVVATVGFLVLLVLQLFRPAATEPALPVMSAARLTMAGLLLATVGGFGSLFNLLVTPQIRGYNRITAYLAFFALLGICWGLEAVTRRWPSRGYAVLASVLVLGVWDQAQAL